MRVLVQRVTRASCVVDEKLVSEIKNGLLLFVGFKNTDNIEDVKYCAKKTANLRVFADENDKINISVLGKGYQILSISQFTLYGSTKKGNRPSFTECLEPSIANELYLAFNRILREEYHIPTKEGIFGADMKIELLNDGPITVMIETEIGEN